MNYRNSKKQGDAGLGQAIAYFTINGYEVALPLTDSADWDLVVENGNGLKKVQVKTSYQLAPSGNEVFSITVLGGNRTGRGTRKVVADQNYDLLFLHHLKTGKQLLIPKALINDKRSSLTICEKYSQYVI